MAELPDEQRTAIMLKEYHGLTFQEIAHARLSVSTVKTRLYQGSPVLRRRLERRQVEKPACEERRGSRVRKRISNFKVRDRLLEGDASQATNENDCLTM
jgi:predicted RNA polymerase sigma factor